MKYLFASHAITRKWVMALLCLIVIAIALAVPAASTACPTCSDRPAAVWGYQPHRSTLGSTFDDAATDSLANAPDYDQIWRGVCPDCYQVTVSTSEPIPSVILKAMGWQESSWRQFDCDIPGEIDNSWDNTLINPGCDYGIMQMHDCMWDGCGWFTPDSVARYVDYNVGTGTNWLIREKWNKLDFYIGGNNHTYPEDWYYAVMWYGPGGWSNSNNPNNGDYSPQRPPYREGDYGNYVYPYQEYIWGHMAHPSWVGQSLWQSERIPWIPRGIFGPDSPDDWQPARETPRPIFYYLPDIKVNSDNWNSYIVLQNTSTDLTLAVDIALYNQDGTFNRWRLDPPINDPPPYIRLDPHASRTLSVADAFEWWESFNGSAVIAASEDVLVTVENRNAEDNTSYAYNGMTAENGTGDAGFGIVGTTIDLPIMMRNYWGWYTAFTVQNAGAEQALVNITYYDEDGNVVGNREINVPIPVNGTIQRDQNDRIEFQPNKMYSAEIVSTTGQPLGVVVQQRIGANPSTSTSFQAYNGFSSGKWPISTPSLLKNYYGWVSSLTVQNVSDQDAYYIYVTYYIGNGNTVTEIVDNVPKKASRVFYQPNNPELPNGLFAARIFSNKNIAVVVNQSNNELNMSYNGFLGGTGLSWQPRVLKNAPGEWTSSVVAQNVGSFTTDITLTYDDGSWETQSGVRPYEHAIFYQGNSQISDGEHWSQVTAGQPIVAIVNASGSGSPDPAWSYNGFNR